MARKQYSEAERKAFKAGCIAMERKLRCNFQKGYETAEIDTALLSIDEDLLIGEKSKNIYKQAEKRSVMRDFSKR